MPGDPHAGHRSPALYLPTRPRTGDTPGGLVGAAPLAAWGLSRQGTPPPTSEGARGPAGGPPASPLPPAASPRSGTVLQLRGWAASRPAPPNRVETPTEPNEATVALRRQPRDRAAPQGGARTPRPPRAPLHGGWLSPALLTCTSHPITGTEPHSDRNPNRQSRGPSRGSFPPVPNSSFESNVCFLR